MAVDGSVTLGLRDQTGKHRDCGRLACAIVTQERKYFTLMHVEREVVDRCLVTKLLVKSVELDARSIFFTSQRRAIGAADRELQQVLKEVRVADEE